MLVHMSSNGVHPPVADSLLHLTHQPGPFIEHEHQMPVTYPLTGQGLSLSRNAM